MPKNGPRSGPRSSERPSGEERGKSATRGRFRSSSVRPRKNTVGTVGVSSPEVGPRARGTKDPPPLRILVSPFPLHPPPREPCGLRSADLGGGGWIGCCIGNGFPVRIDHRRGFVPVTCCICNAFVQIAVDRRSMHPERPRDLALGGLRLEFLDAARDLLGSVRARGGPNGIGPGTVFPDWVGPRARGTKRYRSRYRFPRLGRSARAGDQNPCIVTRLFGHQSTCARGERLDT